MNNKEIGEIRRRLRRERSNITAIYGCYVNENREIISQFRQSTGIMPENESEKYFGLLRRALSGTIGKNLIDINFKTSQVAGSPEHQLLMDLRKTGLEDETLRLSFYQKVMESADLAGNYLILIGCDRYDVPFRSKDDAMQQDASEETYTYLICAVCPVKQTKANLHYVPEDKLFHDGAMHQLVGAPVLGFLFPAFDNRATNIYNALYYTHDTRQGQDAFVDAIFHTPVPKPATVQKESFEALLSVALEEECSMDVVQTVHDQLCQRIEMHKQSRIPDPLMVSKEEMTQVLTDCGVSDPHLAKFSVEYDSVFGFEAELHPKNIIDSRRFEVKTPDVVIKVDPARSDLIETRVIDGVRYILICVDEEIEVNGVSIHVSDREPTAV